MLFCLRFANKKAYVIIFGLAGSILSATYAYHNSTLTTLEKRYKIPTKVIGFIGIGNDISAVLFSGIISYYAGKGHRPRWIAIGKCVNFANFKAKKMIFFRIIYICLLLHYDITSSFYLWIWTGSVIIYC